MKSEGGFTLVEMLVSAAIMLTITGAVFHLTNPAQGAFKAQPELADLQQRLRVSIDALRRDLIMAGAGTYAGTSAGPLTNYFAPVMPYRVGDEGSDADADLFFRADAISLLYVPPTPSQTTIRDAMPKTSSQLKVDAQANCPPSKQDQLCGFTEGMRVILIDPSGAWDPITVTSVQDQALHLGYDGDLSVDYAKGSTITQVAMHTYYLKVDQDEGTSQLMHYDGASTDLPIVDNVVALAFEYFGDARPPALLPNKSLAGLGPWTTYGPKPPALGVSGPFGWPAGENCAFAVEDGQHASRLPVLQEGVGQVRLSADELTDGPWCPGAEAPNRFDADLLRIRRVRVTLRVQVASESLRGTGALFARPGTSLGGERYVPDQEIRFDIAPRNLNLGR